MAPKSAKSKAKSSTAPGPDGEDLSTVGWQQWPQVEEGNFGLVFIVSKKRFGYYDDDDELKLTKAQKRKKPTNVGSSSSSSAKRDDDDFVMGAVVYLGAPLISDYIVVPYEDILQPPFKGCFRADGDMSDSTASGPDEEFSNEGWEDWPHVEEGDYGLVYVVSEERFGYYDDDDAVENKNKAKKKKSDAVDATNGFSSSSSSKNNSCSDNERNNDDKDSVDSWIHMAVIYRDVPLFGSYDLVPYEDLRQPPFEGKFRAI